MEIERKQKLINYLYPNEKIRGFFCDELYIELQNFIPNQICITSKNTSFSSRNENLNKIYSIVNNFVEKNSYYKNKILYFYKDEQFNNIIKKIVIGYVFYLSNAIPRYVSIDIFRDRRSICYSPISIIDIIWII